MWSGQHACFSSLRCELYACVCDHRGRHSQLAAPTPCMCWGGVPGCAQRRQQEATRADHAWPCFACGWTEVYVWHIMRKKTSTRRPSQRRVGVLAHSSHCRTCYPCLHRTLKWAGQLTELPAVGHWRDTTLRDPMAVQSETVDEQLLPFRAMTRTTLVSFCMGHALINRVKKLPLKSLTSVG
jgi:hypothetical protein